MTEDQESRMFGDVHLVGSMPVDGVELVFREAAAAVGKCVTALPDGEVDDRRNWVRYLPMRVYASRPQLEETSREDALSLIKQGEERPTGSVDASHREGERLVFDDLHYGRHAIESYAVFSHLRDEGVIPDGVRLQVVFPASRSAMHRRGRQHTRTRPDLWVSRRGWTGILRCAAWSVYAWAGSAPSLNDGWAFEEDVNARAPQLGGTWDLT